MSVDRWFEIIPTDRTMTRIEYRRLRRLSRVLTQRYTPQVKRASANLIQYGWSGIVVEEGEVRALTSDEIEARLRNRYLSSRPMDNALIAMLDELPTPRE